MIRCDFHVHSTFSDGTLTPSEIVERAQHAGVGCLALTDHDEVAGIDVAEAALRELSEINSQRRVMSKALR